MNLTKAYESCRLCPRQCKINRVKGSDKAQAGFCGEMDQIRVAYVGPHFGEEPPITGKNGSGAVFFTGCSIKCSFCQNHQISHQGLGTCMDVEELLQKLKHMIERNHVHNINFVTPDHFFPHTFHLVSFLREDGFYLPVIFNTSGYQSVEMLRHAEDYSDIYLPDFKYSDSSLAARLSRCPNYPRVALEAIAEMVRQKGFLDVCSSNGKLAKGGVLVRHLILPGNVKNSIDALTTLFVEFGRGLPLSLMSQYHPVLQHDDAALNRLTSEQEFDIVYSHALGLGFEHLFVQFPESALGRPPVSSPFLPDFRREEPFK